MVVRGGERDSSTPSPPSSASCAGSSSSPASAGERSLTWSSPRPFCPRRGVLRASFASSLGLGGLRDALSFVRALACTLCLPLLAPRVLRAPAALPVTLLVALVLGFTRSHVRVPLVHSCSLSCFLFAGVRASHSLSRRSPLARSNLSGPIFYTADFVVCLLWRSRPAAALGALGAAPATCGRACLLPGPRLGSLPPVLGCCPPLPSLFSLLVGWLLLIVSHSHCSVP